LKILLLNGNTDEAITARLAVMLRPSASLMPLALAAEWITSATGASRWTSPPSSPR
jgi:hypothetical protein